MAFSFKPEKDYKTFLWEAGFWIPKWNENQQEPFVLKYTMELKRKKDRILEH